ncbi:hypothetical protein [Mesorhizobium sp.]|uniref:hypothetical protein n=1 Tax=Mesorhizobium sp. TaxID=1871066 RepID=UPI003454D84B
MTAAIYNQGFCQSVMSIGKHKLKVDEDSRRARLNVMAKGGINIGDEVAITAIVRKRVTEDRVSVLIPSYHQPHSMVDTSPNISSGQKIELRGDVTRVNEGRVTINLGVPVTVNGDTVRLVTPYKPPTRKTPLVDKPT